MKVTRTERPLFTREQIAAESVFVAILRAANALNARTDALFKAYGLTSAQYNTLRVLRDAGPQGLCCQEIGAALIQRDPDVTRLADRLADRGLVVKERSKSDRRVVKIHLTPVGLELVSDLDWPIVKDMEVITSQLTNAQCQELMMLLKKVETG